MNEELPPPPSFLYLQSNQRCNLRCNHCFYWQTNDDDKSKYFPVDRREALIREFAKLGGKTLVTCGGEPTLDWEDWFDMAKWAHDAGMRMFSVTNGTKINTPERASRVIDEGPDEISVSLDSHLPEEHDQDRGVKGSFKMAVLALRRLVAYRNHARDHGWSGGNKYIHAMTIIHEGMYRNLDAFHDFVLNDIGADKLKLNVIQPSFQNDTGKDPYFAVGMVKDTGLLGSVLRVCDEKYNLQLNPVWVKQVQGYFDSIKYKQPERGWDASQNLGGTSEHLCNTYERNIMVNMEGVARLCFSIAHPGMKLNKPGDLTYFWNQWAVPLREKMKTCNSYCGISHSVRKEPASLRRLPFVQPEAQVPRVPEESGRTLRPSALRLVS